MTSSMKKNIPSIRDLRLVGEPIKKQSSAWYQHFVEFETREEVSPAQRKQALMQTSDLPSLTSTVYLNDVMRSPYREIWIKLILRVLSSHGRDWVLIYSEKEIS